MEKLRILAAVLFLLCATVPAWATEFLGNPDWEIELWDSGYSDILLDKTPGREGREYLSGEWAAAIGYKVGNAPTTAPIWLEPMFVFPDWPTNSDFSVLTPIMLGAPNGDGLPTAMSSIYNSDISVHISYEMLDTTTGIEQGATPASSAAPPVSVTSNRYILSQRYTITNISGEPITELQAFQFIHGLESQVALYDDRDYGGPFGTYKHDTFEIGTSMYFNDQTQQDERLEDIITFHSEAAPSAVEVGYYGSQLAGDDHASGKPSVGVHWSVEANALSGADFFAPPDLWVSGAQRYDLISLMNMNDSVSFDVLLSISTESLPIPEPGSFAVLALGLAGMIGRRRRK
jgi:hypothetical protein